MVEFRVAQPIECSEGGLSEHGGSEEGLSGKGSGEGRGEMEQELLNESYTEGKSDSETELPDSEYDADTVTLKELVKTDESNEHEKERISQLWRDARNKQWENVAKKNLLKEAVKEAKVAVKEEKVEVKEAKMPSQVGAVRSLRVKLKYLTGRRR